LPLLVNSDVVYCRLPVTVPAVRMSVS